MRKLIFIIILSYLCLLVPLHASASTYSSPTLTVNQIIYDPLHTAFMVEDTLYISGEDLSLMTYSDFSVQENGICLKLQNSTLIFNANSRYVYINGKIHLMTEPAVLNNTILYLPITCLDLLQYPYTFSPEDLTLNINPVMPYALATDTYKSHLLLTIKGETLASSLSPLNNEVEKAALIQEARTNNAYLSFATTYYKQTALEAMKDINRKNYDVQVHFRNISRFNHTPHISGFTTIPFSYSIDQDGVYLKSSAFQKKYTCFWATYNPALNQPAIDLNKSLDVMVMRSLYEIYRDTYDLKDDVHVEPIIKVVRGRCDTISYKVYFDALNQNTHYEVVIYQKTNANTIDYYVDFRLSD